MLESSVGSCPVGMQGLHELRKHSLHKIAALMRLEHVAFSRDVARSYSHRSMHTVFKVGRGRGLVALPLQNPSLLEFHRVD